MLIVGGSENDSAPGFSPDGTLMAFIRDSTRHERLHEQSTSSWSGRRQGPAARHDDVVRVRHLSGPMDAGQPAFRRHPPSSMDDDAARHCVGLERQRASTWSTAHAVASIRHVPSARLAQEILFRGVVGRPSGSVRDGRGWHRHPPARQPTTPPTTIATSPAPSYSAGREPDLLSEGGPGDPATMDAASCGS